MEKTKRDGGEQFFTRKCCFCKLFSFELSVFLALTVLSGVGCQSPFFLVDPVSVAAVDGTTVEFSCTAEDVEDVIFRVNGSSASGEDVVGKGFVQLDEELFGGTVRRRNLTVTVSSLYNNSEIFCRAIGTDDIVNSETANLTVQGNLSSVGNVRYYFINSSTVNISWSPPFTLPGIAITGYNISVTSNGTTTNYFIPDSHFVLKLSDITDSPCNEINITVSGYNGLNGEWNLPISLYLKSVPSPDSMIPISVAGLKETYDLVNITFQINVTDLCPGEYPDLIDIDIFSGNHTLVAFQENTMVSVTTLLTDVSKFILLPDQRYTAIVCFENIAGEFNITSIVNFSTHAVQSISFTVTGSIVVFECVFAPNTEAVACFVEIVLLTNELFYRGMRSNRIGDIAVVTFQNVLAGEYRLTVFDVEQDDSRILALTKSIIVSSERSTAVRMSVTSTQYSSGISESSITSSLVILPEKTITNSGGGPDINIFIISIVIGGVMAASSCIAVCAIFLLVLVKRRKRRDSYKETVEVQNVIPYKYETDVATFEQEREIPIMSVLARKSTDSCTPFLDPDEEYEETVEVTAKLGKSTAVVFSIPPRSNSTGENTIANVAPTSSMHLLNAQTASLKENYTHSCEAIDDGSLSTGPIVESKLSSVDQADCVSPNQFGNSGGSMLTTTDSETTPFITSPKETLLYTTVVHLAEKDRAKVQLTPEQSSVYSSVDHVKSAKCHQTKPSTEVPPVPPKAKQPSKNGNFPQHTFEHSDL